MKTSSETGNAIRNDETLKYYEMLECFSCRKTRECYLMREKETDRLVVAKVFYPEDELFGQRQPDEIRKISFPGVPAFIEEIRDEKRRIEIREFIPGKTLERAAAEKELTAKEILDISLKLCDILEKLHDRPAPVIHRDVKPQNVVINEEGEVFLIDFDIARIAKEEDRGEEPSTDTVVFGTQMFAAPEQYGFSRTDARSDIYSLGVLIRWLLDRVTNEAQKETKEYRLLSAVAKKCSELDPGRRYQCISKVKDVLLHKKEKRAFLGLSAAVLFGIVLAAVLLFGKKTEAVTFEEPVLEEAIRLQLGKTNGEEIREADLLKVENIFAACDRAFLTEEEYYEAVSVLDAAGENEKGKLSKLGDIAKCRNLKKLCLAYEAVTDISVLSGNTKLEKLELKKDNVKDIDVVRDLPELRSVGLCGDPVTDISPLRELEHLLYLDLCGVDGYESSVLNSFPHLEYLDINNRAVSYRYLEGNSIKRLRLGYVNTNDFSFLLGIRDLETVEANFQNAGAIRKLGETTFSVEYKY
ncbi:MAG: protein kinase [Eubacteriales bacterium]|nr:protein kinase [Eubacteriales bacterium]